MNPSSPSGTPPGKEAADKAQRKARADGSAATEQIKDDVKHVRDEVTAEARTLAHEAEAQAGKAVDNARGFATEQKDLAARQVGGVADAVKRAADELGDDQAAIAGQLRKAAGELSRLADDVHDRSLDELVGMAEDFGRKRPAAFIGAAAIAGFAASRFLSASAERRHTGTAAADPYRLPKRRVSEAEIQQYSETRPTEAAK